MLLGTVPWARITVVININITGIIVNSSSSSSISHAFYLKMFYFSYIILFK